MAEIFKELGIEPRLLLVNLIAFLAVMYLLTKFFFKPFGTFLTERAEHIRQQVSEAEQARKDAEAQVEQVRQEQQAARDKLAQEAEEFRRQARAEAQKIVADANRTARERREAAEAELERRRLQLEEDLRVQTATLATDIARKALVLSLRPEDQAATVEAAVSRVQDLAQGSQN
jgi:F-type H+-transporting ATPase subunit b